MVNVDTRFNSLDLPLAKELAGMLTLEIRRFLLERQESAGIILSNKTLSIVSHELKTPVTSLKTVLQVLQNRMLDDPQKFNFHDNAEYIGFSLREIDRLTVLVNDLLDFNKLNQKALQFNLQNSDIHTLVTDVVRRMTALCDTHIIAYAEADVHCIVSLDVMRFEQVLTNLITNAVKYSPKGSVVTILLSTDAKHAIISVHDEGMGMSPEDMQHIFEPYYRTPTAIASGIGGLGIGLYISKEIVNAHHGRIAVTSSDKGTTFTIALPKAAEPENTEVIHRFNTLDDTTPKKNKDSLDR